MTMNNGTMSIRNSVITAAPAKQFYQVYRANISHLTLTLTNLLFQFHKSSLSRRFIFFKSSSDSFIS